MIKSSVGDLDFNAVYDIVGRFETLQSDIQEHITRFQELSPALKQLLHDFQLFCDDYFTFFAYLEEADYQKETTRSELLSSILSKLSHEWSAIRQAAEQRGLDLYRDALHNADQLAAGFYSAFPSGNDGPGLVTYFHKIQDIARFPYSDVPLLGIPLEAAQSDAAAMAVAHEVGHYVFWHSTKPENHGQTSRILSQAVSNRLLADHSTSVQSNPDELRRLALVIGIWLQWLEECFADVYGCLVGGPFYTLAAQDLFMQKIGTGQDLVRDDGAHPVAYVRPTIQVAALQAMERHFQAEGNTDMANTLADAAQLLDGRWHAFRSSLPNPPSEWLHEGTGLPVSEIADHLPAVVDRILNEPVFVQEDSGEEKVSLLRSVELLTQQPEQKRMSNELLARIQDDVSHETWQTYQQGSRIKRQPAMPQFKSVAFRALKKTLEDKEGKKPLWRRLADQELAIVSEHDYYLTHTYTYHNTTHYHYHRHYS